MIPAAEVLRVDARCLMAARTGDQFLQGLKQTKRELWLEHDRVTDVTAHPKLAGGARTVARLYDLQHERQDECLIPDAESGDRLVAMSAELRSIVENRK